MPLDTPEEALVFDIRHALRTFTYAPPRKCHAAAMREWKDRLAQHVLRCQWDLRCKETRDVDAERDCAGE